MRSTDDEARHFGAKDANIRDATALERLREEMRGEFRAGLEALKAEIADEEMETGELALTRLYRKADDSYYFRVQAMLMYDPLDFRTLSNFVAVLFFIALQVFSLEAIWQVQYHARANHDLSLDDDEISEYRSGLPHPVDYYGLLGEYDDTRFLGLPLLLVTPLIFCSLMVTLLTLSGEWEQLKAGYLLMRREWSLAAPAAAPPRVDAAHAFRVGACSLIWVFRASLVWFYLDIVGFMMGTADGPFNLLLNALAMGFVLELDDVLQPDLPSQNFFGVNNAVAFELHAKRTKRARETCRL